MISMKYLILSLLLLFFHILSISIVTAQDATKNIYNNIANTPQLITLGALLNLVPTFTNTITLPGQYTFFAPNNDALGAINANSTEIQDFLNYQLINGTITSQSFNPKSYPKSMLMDPLNPNQGQAIVIDGMNIRCGWKSASIVLADQVSSNGVIHIVDGGMKFIKFFINFISFNLSSMHDFILIFS